MRKTARAIIFKDNKLLVFFRRKIKDGNEITYYAIPGGHVEGNETCEETVIRELKEEIRKSKAERVCANCGAAIEENTIFCPICGQKLEFTSED